MNVLGTIGGGISTLITGFLVFIVVALVIVILLRGYVKAPPDVATVISGRKKKPRFVHGTSTICIPILERRDKLTLQVIDIDLHTSEAVPTKDYIAVNVDAAVNVKVDVTDEERMQAAAQNFLNMKPSDIARVVAPVLEGNVREIIGKMELKSMVSDREQFARLVKESAEPDMNALGLTIKTFNVQNFSDRNGVIDALGVENQAQIMKDAAVSKAKNEQIVREESARAEQAANQAEVQSKTAIAERENELRIRKAGLKQESDAKQAEADVAYQLQEEQQRADLERRTAEADIARQEKEIELEEKRVAVEQKRLEAEVNKKADAELYKAQRDAEAELYKRQKNAEAEKVARELEAEAKKVTAELEAEAAKVAAEAARFAKEQEAEGIRALGEAEAAREKAIGEAKAAALEKEAEAMEKLGQAALAKTMIEAMPAIAHEFAAPMSNIGNVSIIGGGSDSGMGTYMDAMPVAMGKFFQAMKETTGIDMADIMSGDAKSAQVERHICIDSKSGQDSFVDAIAKRVVSKTEVPVVEMTDAEQ